MATFQAKIVWKRPRKRENKNNSLVLFLPDALQKIQKKQQNNSKNKKNSIMASFHRLKEAEKERKQLLSFCFVPTQREIENSKKKEKKLKKI